MFIPLSTHTTPCTYLTWKKLYETKRNTSTRRTCYYNIHSFHTVVLLLNCFLLSSIFSLLWIKSASIVVLWISILRICLTFKICFHITKESIIYTLCVCPYCVYNFEQTESKLWTFINTSVWCDSDAICWLLKTLLFQTSSFSLLWTIFIKLFKN